MSKYFIEVEARVRISEEVELTEEQFEILNESEDEDEILEVLTELNIDWLSNSIEDPEINGIKKVQNG